MSDLRIYILRLLSKLYDRLKTIFIFFESVSHYSKIVVTSLSELDGLEIKVLRTRLFLDPNILFCFRLVLTAVLLASKVFNDTYFTNRYIAEVGGVTLANINDLERYFI